MLAARCFPGDPRFGSRVNPTREHIEALGKKEMLNACLLDSLLQRAAMPPKDSSTDREICHLGNLSALEYLENTNVYFHDLADKKCNPSPDEATRIRAKIQQPRITFFHKIFQMEKDVVDRLLIPIVDSCHFPLVLTAMLPAPNSTYKLHFMIPRCDGRQEGRKEWPLERVWLLLCAT
jgi:hypothetical protein